MIRLMKFKFGKILALMLLVTFNSYSELQSQEEETEKILQSYIESYKNDNMALSVTFGIQIGEQWWHVVSKRKQEGYAVGKSKQYTFHNYGPNEVTLHKGKPKTATWYFTMAERSVLDKLNDDVWNAGTASMRSFSSDKVAFDIKAMKGFEMNQEIDAITYQVMEHFWKKGDVEITSFERDKSLPTHGASVVSLYTMKYKRIAWFSINKEEKANADPRLDKGQVPNLMIFTKGKGKALFADKEIDVKAGMSVFIGPYVKHVIFNPNDEPLEGILVLYGDNIDFAQGQSYLDFLEKQYQFLESNQLKTQ